ncbi:unnamed protein product [Peniophora sp. CBMAI 1063]|nr:unnamed protein product [Peniophora sp. CBMAI 1063]
MPDRSNTERDKSELPIDIIKVIFDHAAAIDPPQRSPPHRSFYSYTPSTLGWITLTHVCANWRNVGLSMPTLWAAIAAVFLNTSAVNTFLARAGSCPLTIDLTKHPLGELRGHTMISCLRKHLSQVSVLEVGTFGVYDLLRADGEAPLSTPALYKIRVGHTAYIPSGDESDLNRFRILQLNATELRSATLTNAILPSDCVRGLRELRLKLTQHHSPSLSDLHDFIRCCSQLETLDIAFTCPRAEPDAGYRAREIPLNNLKRAVLSAYSQEQLCQIWGPIVGCDDIVLDLSCTGTGPTMPPNAVPALFTLCAAQLLSTHYDAIELTAHHGLKITIYQLSTQRVCHSWALSTVQHNRVHLLSVLPRHIRAELIRSLSLDSTLLQSDQISHVFRAFGSAMTGLTDLKLGGMNQWPASLYIRALGRGRPTPAFRALQRLTITDMELGGKSLDRERSHAQYWWDALHEALIARLCTGGEAFRLRRLVLDGTWLGVELWDLGHDQEALRKISSLWLTQEVVDTRTYARSSPQWKPLSSFTYQ